MILIWIEVRRDDHTVAKLAPSKRLLRLLAVDDRVELDKHLATAGHVHPFDGARDFDAPHHTVLVALLPNVLENVLVLFLVLQLVRRDHVQQAQHLGRWTRRTD